MVNDLISKLKNHSAIGVPFLLALITVTLISLNYSNLFNPVKEINFFGEVRDKLTRQTIADATVFLNETYENAGIRIVTDENGFFSRKVYTRSNDKTNIIKITVYARGYKENTITLENEDRFEKGIFIELDPDPNTR